jgi:hypothetical protein
MGKSVLFLPSWKTGAQGEQLGRLRERFGQDGLKLEGPFSKTGKDGGKAFAEILARVQERADGSGINGKIEATLITLMPQDGIPPDSPRRSTLGIPFVSAIAQRDGWHKQYPKSAGDMASAPTVGFDGGVARPAGRIKLTALAVSMLRSLDVECYFSLCTCIERPSEETLSELEANGTVRASVIPMIMIPDISQPRLESVIPYSAYSESFFSDYRPVSFEVLDGDSLLALIKMRDALLHAKELMTDMAQERVRSDSGRMAGSIDIAHMLYEGTSFWTMPEAQADAWRAREFYGLRGPNWLVSSRERAENDIVHGMTCRYHHAKKAASMMLCGDFQRELGKPAEGKDPGNAFFDTLLAHSTSHRCFAPFNEYLGLIDLMKEHFHPASGCNPMKAAK